MDQSAKLKPVKWSMILINSILFVVGFFTLFAIMRAVTTEIVADRISAVMYIIIVVVLLLGWFKTKSILLLPGILMNLMIAVYFFTGARTTAITINVVLLIIAAYMIYAQLKHHSRIRKLFELAAGTIVEAKDGYTERAYPVGTADYSKGELMGFAAYLKKNYIAAPIQESTGLVLILADEWFGYLLDLHKNYDHSTKIIFGYDGNVSTFISKSDYTKYKQALTFDQLCASLGGVFMEFMQQYKSGELDKILDKL